MRISVIVAVVAGFDLVPHGGEILMGLDLSFICPLAEKVLGVQMSGFELWGFGRSCDL